MNPIVTPSSTTRPVVTCYCDVDLVHAAYPVTGLIELADAGEIDLRFQYRDPCVHDRRMQWTLWLRVQSSQADVPVAIDLHDLSRYLCAESLRECRYYYKVNFNAQTLDAAPAEFQFKIVPFGPYFPCRPTKDRSTYFRYFSNLAVSINRRLWRSKKSLSAKLLELAGDVRRLSRYRTRLVWRDYESPPGGSVKRPKDWKIVYNPACWDEFEGDEIRRMNEFRARLILALRREFGSRFVGGLRRNSFAASHYPEALEPEPISHDAYLRLLRESPVAVYSNGKFGCFSWRFAESFAASKCIVSESIPNFAGEALDERVGCLQCDSVDEMTSKLAELVHDDDAISEYSGRAAAYYDRRLRPQQRMRRLLEEVVGPAAAFVAPSQLHSA